MAANRTLIRARPRQPRPVALQGTNAGGSLETEAFYALLGMTAQAPALPVNDASVRGLPAAWSALNKISNAVGQMMTAAEVLAADGRTPAAVPAVVDQPDVSLDSFTYWKMVAATAITRGNFIGLKVDYDPVLVYPRQVIAVPSDSVNAYYDDNNYVVYEIGGEEFSPDDVVHVRCGITVPGRIMTIGVIEAHRRGLAGQLALQGMANSVWTDGAVPSGHVQVDVDYPTQAQADLVKANWISNMGGRRTVAVTGKKMSYTPITWSADDAEFIESQQFSVAMVALMFGLQPSDLDATIGGNAMTYGNRQDDALQRIVDAYTPVMLPIEQAWSRLIPGKAFVRGNPEALLRSTTEQRYALHATAQAIGLEDVDETRAAEGRPARKQPDPTPPAPATDPAEPEPTTEEVTE